jgi:membrane protein required for beta-lactamase induction
LGSFRKNTELAHIFWTIFFPIKLMYWFLPKMGWATVWANFSQTHLVTQGQVQKRSGWLDWANFRLLGDCLLGGVCLKITEVAQIFGLLFSAVKVMF